MRQPVLVAALALACVVLPATAPLAARHPARAPAQGYTRPAEQVLTQARAVSGGASWSLLRGWHETGQLDGVAYEAWFDPLRYGKSVDDNDPAGVAATRTDAFFGAAGYFHRARFDARGELLGVRQAEGRSFDVVLVKPWGGNARELWFDRRTHLLARMVDRSGPKPVTQTFSDYRRVGPVVVAFHIVADAPGGPEDRRLDSIVFAPADRALFSLPRTADAAPPQ
jgi:hypothetical protein